MTTRRSFIKNAGLVTGGFAFPNFLWSFMQSSDYNYKPGLQLYTVRKAMEKAPEETLARVAEIGYKIVESATYTGSEKFYGMSPAEYSSALQKSGLKMPSGHYELGNSHIKGTLLNDWEKTVEDAYEVGMKYMVCASIPGNRQKSLDGYKKTAEEFNKAAETCQKAGIQFCYHNHAFEFDKIEGQEPYSLLLQEADSDLVKMELDIYWATYAGKDVVQLLEDHKNRIELWHVKGMAENKQRGFTELGQGTINWPKLFSKAQETNLKHFFVEQDETPGNPFDSIAQSITYLENNILS